MARAYKKCLDLERAREWKWRHTKQGRFESAMVSIEQFADNAAQDKSRIFARNATLGSVVAGSDREDAVEVSKRKLDNACRHLCDVGQSNLVRVLRLIAKNRENREESICELMSDDIARQKDDTSTTAKNCAPISALQRVKNGSKSGAVKKKSKKVVK